MFILKYKWKQWNTVHFSLYTKEFKFVWRASPSSIGFFDRLCRNSWKLFLLRQIAPREKIRKRISGSIDPYPNTRRFSFGENTLSDLINQPRRPRSSSTQFLLLCRWLIVTRFPWSPCTHPPFQRRLHPEIPGWIARCDRGKEGKGRGGEGGKRKKIRIGNWRSGEGFFLEPRESAHWSPVVATLPFLDAPPRSIGTRLNA